jgi:thiol-disulfide isomerase/thioredoxin
MGMGVPTGIGALNGRSVDLDQEEGPPVSTVHQLAVPPDTIRPVREGKVVPAFEVRGLQDSTRAIGPSDFEGQHVLINLWATWCSPCIDKIPALRKARERFSSEMLAVLNVSFDRARPKAISFLKDREFPGTHAYVGGGSAGLVTPFGNKFARMPSRGPSARGLPSMVLVGPDGEVVEAVSAGEAHKTDLLKLLERQLS